MCIYSSLNRLGMLLYIFFVTCIRLGTIYNSHRVIYCHITCIKYQHDEAKFNMRYRQCETVQMLQCDITDISAHNFY